MSKYKSRYTDKLVPACDIIAQSVNENLALKKGQDLPFQYWRHSQFWLREFRRQQQLARSLICIYGEDILLEFIRQPEFKKIVSLAAEWIVDPTLTFLAEAKQKRLNKQDKSPSIIPHKKPETDGSNRPIFNKNKNKLKDL